MNLCSKYNRVLTFQNLPRCAPPSREMHQHFWHLKIRPFCVRPRLPARSNINTHFEHYSNCISLLLLTTGGAWRRWSSRPGQRQPLRRQRRRATLFLSTIPSGMRTRRSETLERRSSTTRSARRHPRRVHGDLTSGSTRSCRRAGLDPSRRPSRRCTTLTSAPRAPSEEWSNGHVTVT